MTAQNYVLFTRTPLHVGAGASVGAIDQPVQRERHTGFPIIPGSSLKGAFADQWPVTLRDEKDQLARLTTREEKGEGDRKKIVPVEVTETAWLFGSDTTKLAFAGALLFSEARLLAFPIRSARGSYGWITSPTLLERARRDGFTLDSLAAKPSDDTALFDTGGPLAIRGDETGVVLEDYFLKSGGTFPGGLASQLAALLPEDDLFQGVASRLVVVSDGMMSHFATTACEVAQHVRINDETGTAEGTGLFNQENVPADTLFYTVLRAEKSRSPKGSGFESRTTSDALTAFSAKVTEVGTFQFGGDASTGLGFTSVSPVPSSDSAA